MESRGSSASDGGLWFQYHHRNQPAARLIRLRDAGRCRDSRNPWADAVYRNVRDIHIQLGIVK